jgi:hypothetical protein
MSWGFRLSLVGSVVLVALAGCGRSFFQVGEREAWRHAAEVQCLKSGAVRESSALVRISPIGGPGICGAAFPLKVAALGESAALGFADNLRPPAAIQNSARGAQPRWPVSQPPYAPPTDIYSPPPPAIYSEPPPVFHDAPRTYRASAPETYLRPSPPRYGAPMTPGEPLSLTPPGIADLIAADQFEQASRAQPPSRPPARPAYHPPPAAPVSLGPASGPHFTGSAGPVEIKPAATLACPIVSALDQWIAGSVQPAAMRWFGQPVAEIKQISAYSCRGMNGQAGARISEHAFANALDIAAFTLADGRKVVVRTAWNGLPEEQGFLRDIQGAACNQFSTVLAPGSNRFHYDHIHLDLMRRSSRRQICQPAAIPGEVAAARAAQRNYARRGDPGVTGSIAAIDAKGSLPSDAIFEDDHEGIIGDEYAPENETERPKPRAWFSSTSVNDR